ncbi:hypothetical protein B7Z28_00115, partial [Candidatus Saccharibacteria bacterium 32-45-3]
SGSTRPVSAGDKIFSYIKNLAIKKGMVVDCIDIRRLSVTEHVENKLDHPSMNLSELTEHMKAADAVLLVTPELNSGLSRNQQNILMRAKKYCQGKPVGLVGYGWSFAKQVHMHAYQTLKNVGAYIIPSSVRLSFMKDISTHGDILDTKHVGRMINSLLDDLRVVA